MDPLTPTELAIWCAAYGARYSETRSASSSWGVADDAVGAFREEQKRRGLLACVTSAHPLPPQTPCAGSESPGARGFWVVELESTDENDPGWFLDSGGAGDDKLIGYHLREEAEKKGQESVGIGYRWRVVWVAPANPPHQVMSGEPEEVKPAAEALKGGPA